MKRRGARAGGGELVNQAAACNARARRAAAGPGLPGGVAGAGGGPRRALGGGLAPPGRPGVKEQLRRIAIPPTPLPICFF